MNRPETNEPVVPAVGLPVQQRVRPLDRQTMEGKRGVRVRDDGFGIELLWTRNGWQWAGAGVDTELLRMIRDACDDALKMIAA